MSIGRNFKEALQKGLRSLETKKNGLDSILFKGRKKSVVEKRDLDIIYQKLREPNADRIFYIADAMRAGIGMEEVYSITKVDPWFLNNIKEIVSLEEEVLSSKEILTKICF